jgi:hypothetical protein
MQDESGSMRMLSDTELGGVPFWKKGKVLHEGQVFKIKRCYFQISEITTTGIVARGISREMYYGMKRGRPDWC